jgi:hypothetical protein
MRYFNSLPNITVTDNNNNSVVMKNLLVRTQLLPELNKNPLLFYKYSIQEGDTPEIIADKYYGDSYRFWMVLYGNSNIQDPQFDWALTSSQFLDYLKDKYKVAAGGEQYVLAYTQSTVHHYEKLTTTIDELSKTETIKNVVVDFQTYQSIVDSTTTKTFSNGTSVTLKESKKVVSIYTYELEKNEAKRDIILIDSNYTSQMESSYNALVNL